ncbi:branched-chain amino acid ABC transporter permease [uncultured Alsobacter sp.]|uniref:branched-chain amino acid ABC transporter permease n=1 Tax=uncultured Alsobacter sp. TaxID=1748258 RepID=UPI0025DF2BE7|nr:branched-chain amino acid ABC transporter permease [uncultured Alsobacter sp.]
MALVAPFLLYPIFLINVLCFALFACAFNLMMGFAGLLSFGHAAFFGGSAYVTAYAAKAWGWPAELSILAGLVTGGGLGVVFGWISIRRQGIYFGMVTMALAQLVYFAALQAKFTGGEDGIQGVPQRSALPMLDLTDNRVMYFYALAVFLAGFAVIYRTVHSPFGHVLRAIRENEGRAISLGYDVPRFKLLAFALSGALSGLAGGLKAIALQIATLTDVEFTMSGEVVLMTLVGGVATLTGPVVGAAVVVAMLTYLAAFGVWVKALQGIIFIACVLAFRRGIVGEIAAMLERSRQT